MDMLEIIFLFELISSDWLIVNGELLIHNVVAIHTNKNPIIQYYETISIKLLKIFISDNNVEPNRGCTIYTPPYFYQFIVTQ